VHVRDLPLAAREHIEQLRDPDLVERRFPAVCVCMMPSARR
jgi:hypothetical protein